MSYPININIPNYPGIPNDDIHLDIDYDVTRCATLPRRLQIRLRSMQRNGLTVPISKIIAYAGLHFANLLGIQGQFSTNVHLEKIRLVWNLLAYWNPRSEIRQRDGQAKLVLDNLNEPNLQRWVSELLGVGVGLIIGKHLYQRPYRFWKTNENPTFDFSCYGNNGGNINLEVRGRFRRRNWQDAIDQIHAKINANSSFQYYAGVIFAPRISAATIAADVEIIDPFKEGKRPIRYQKYRDLLLHYVPYFECNSAFNISDRLRNISELNNKEFKKYLLKGDKLLEEYQESNRFQYRNIDRNDYRGFVLDGVPVPFRVETKDSRLCRFFWGLHDKVYNSIVKGNLFELSRMKIHEASFKVENSYNTYLDDGTVLQWNI